jgi:hypothetical protein
MTEQATPVQAFQELMEFVAEGVDLEAISGLNYGEGAYEEGDVKAPFFSEAFLYNLVGKGDARSILGLMRQLSEAIKAEST